MKTRLQYFNNLPDEVKQKAISNMQNAQGINANDFLIQKCESLEEAIYGAFIFFNTAEGFNYWQNISIKYGNQ